MGATEHQPVVVPRLLRHLLRHGRQWPDFGCAPDESLPRLRRQSRQKPGPRFSSLIPQTAQHVYCDTIRDAPHQPLPLPSGDAAYLTASICFRGTVYHSHKPLSKTFRNWHGLWRQRFQLRQSPDGRGLAGRFCAAAPQRLERAVGERLKLSWTVRVSERGMVMADESSWRPAPLAVRRHSPPARGCGEAFWASAAAGTVTEPLRTRNLTQ